MVKVDLITGFLGSGKTTFIKKYAQYLIDQGYRIGIIENDSGPAGRDGRGSGADGRAFRCLSLCGSRWYGKETDKRRTGGSLQQHQGTPGRKGCDRCPGQQKTRGKAFGLRSDRNYLYFRRDGSQQPGFAGCGGGPCAQGQADCDHSDGTFVGGGGRGPAGTTGLGGHPGEAGCDGPY